MQALRKMAWAALTSVLTIATVLGGGHDGSDNAAAAEDPPRLTLIRNVRVWDGTSDTAAAGQSLLVKDKLIAAIGPAGTLAADGATVIEGRGLFLMPGIIDAHGHLAISASPDEVRDADQGYLAAISVKAAEIYLMRGWTTVRDMSGPAQGIAQAIDEGIVIGPRVYPSAANISQTSGHGDHRGLNDPHPNIDGSNWVDRRYSLIADGPAEVKRAVRESLRMGATQIKVMAGGGISSDYDPIDTTQYSVAELRAAVEAAEEFNTYVAVHAYTDAAVEKALEAGVKVIEHGHLLSEDILKKLRANDAYISSQSFGFIRQFIRPGATQPSGRAARAAQVMTGVDNLMETAKKLGIPVAFGTDAFGSLRAYRAGVSEFGYRTRWFSSPEILRQATSHNAKLLALTGPRNPYPDGPLGVIEKGAYADLLLVDGDPLSDVTALEDHETNIRLIMKDGMVYKNTL